MRDLRGDQVDLWWIQLESSSALAATFWPQLSEDEQQRARRLRDTHRSQQFVGSRGALRVVLSNYLGIPPASVVFQYSQFGKPNLGRSTHIADIRFNIAHSHQMLLIGVTLGRDIGVDLEYRDPAGSLGSLASQTLNDQEMSTFLKLDESPGKEFLLQAWTRKEAFAKASGTGLRDPDFSRQVEKSENQWRYQHIGSVPLYAAALVVAITDNRQLLLREITINLLEISHSMRYPDDVRGLQSRANVQNREWST